MSHLVPDKAVTLWGQGYTVREIVSMVTDRHGQGFSKSGIQGAIYWARAHGDPRAAVRPRRKGLKRRRQPIKGAWPYRIDKGTGEVSYTK